MRLLNFINFINFIKITYKNILEKYFYIFFTKIIMFMLNKNL
ncbi:hypothetical protein GT23_1200 [Parageobacillus thermoglucosidasius]|nr:hypothetical protein GT23_1200 [Parageobacillus thermoglucosidasius]